MSQAKEEALELIRRMPETTATADIPDELLFKEQVERGLRDVSEGRTISHEELKELREQIAIGLDQAKRGEHLDGTEVMSRLLARHEQRVRAVEASGRTG